MATTLSGSSYDFTLRPDLNVSLDHVGSEREPVLLIDGVMRHPEALIDYAAREVAFKPAWGPTDGFPGIRAPAPLNYVGSLVRAVSPMMEEAFALAKVKLSRAECNFSVVTLPPERLAPRQRIPHVDTDDALQFALLHYLCDPRFGGTAFYRHRATGFETITPDRLADYEAARDRELAETPPGPGYIIADTGHYDQIGAVDARFDRLLIYRSRLLHSGRITPGIPLPPDPRSGRLSANIFVNYRALA
jgi:hypothetical protein